MGHYDDSYEFERENQLRENKESLIKEVKSISFKSNDIDMLLDIINNIDDWRGVYNLIRRK